MKIKNLFILVFMVSVVACSSPRIIPLDKMERIISEALITNAITNTGQGYYPIVRQEDDTVDYYSEILRRYGYNMADFLHTTYSLSTRKSNPLNEIFGRVASGMDSLAAIAEYRYNVAKKYDTLVLNYYADTLYRKDTTIIGSLSKYKIQLHDIKEGIYRITFDYVTLSDYGFGTKALEHRTGKTGVKLIDPAQRVWINRSLDTIQFSTNVNITSVADTLLISFYEPKISKEKLQSMKDTSMISKVMVVYMPPVAEARKMYYEHYFDSIKLYQIIRYEKDSLPIPFRR